MDPADKIAYFKPKSSSELDTKICFKSFVEIDCADKPCSLSYFCFNFNETLLHHANASMFFDYDAILSTLEGIENFDYYNEKFWIQLARECGLLHKTSQLKKAVDRHVAGFDKCTKDLMYRNQNHIDPVEGYRAAWDYLSTECPFLCLLLTFKILCLDKFKKLEIIHLRSASEKALMNLEKVERYSSDVWKALPLIFQLINNEAVEEWMGVGDIRLAESLKIWEEAHTVAEANSVMSILTAKYSTGKHAVYGMEAGELDWISILEQILVQDLKSSLHKESTWTMIAEQLKITSQRPDCMKADFFKNVLPNLSSFADGNILSYFQGYVHFTEVTSLCFKNMSEKLSVGHSVSQTVDDLLNSDILDNSKSIETWVHDSITFICTNSEPDSHMSSQEWINDLF